MADTASSPESAVEKTANVLASLIPQLFFDLIARVIPGGVIIVAFAFALPESMFKELMDVCKSRCHLPEYHFFQFCWALVAVYAVSIVFYGVWSALVWLFLLSIRTIAKPIAERTKKHIVEPARACLIKWNHRRARWWLERLVLFLLPSRWLERLILSPIWRGLTRLCETHLRSADRPEARRSLQELARGRAGAQATEASDTIMAEVVEGPMAYSLRHDYIKLLAPTAGARITKLKAEIHMSGALFAAFVVCAALSLCGMQWLRLALFVLGAIGAYFSNRHFDSRLRRSVASYSQLLEYPTFRFVPPASSDVPPAGRTVAP